MKGRSKRIWVWIGMMCLIVGVSVGCGQKQGKGEEDETQSSRIESSRLENSRIESSRLENSTAQYGEPDDSAGRSEAATDDSGSKEGPGAEDPASADSDAESEETESRSLIAGNGEEPEEKEIKAEEGEAMSQVIMEEPMEYYLSEADKQEVIQKLVKMGESYGMTYYPDVKESETWDSPTPIYEEELIWGREHVMDTMIEYTEGAFVLMQMEGCRGFALAIKERPETVTDAYYEVYVYWM